jgi:hypothetical protein
MGTRAECGPGTSLRSAFARVGSGSGIDNPNSTLLQERKKLMADKITFRGARIRYFDGRQEEGGAFVRIHMTSEFSTTVMEAMGWTDPGASVTDAKLEGELHATNFVLTPGDKQLVGHEIQFDIRSVEDFKVVTVHEKESSSRRELRYVVRSSAEDVAAMVDSYIRRIGDHQGLLAVSYTKQQELFDNKTAAKAPKPEKSGCRSCDARIPLNDGTAVHVNGEVCDAPQMPFPPMETEAADPETTAASVDPASYEPTTELPNEHGVYICDPTVVFEKKVGKLFGAIEALLTGPDEWISGLSVEGGKRLRSEQLKNHESFSTLDMAVAVKAIQGEQFARAEINQHKGAKALAWLELANWFMQQWTSRRPESFATVEDWQYYLEGLNEPEATEDGEPVQMAEAV